MLKILIFILMGIISGTFTGLTPGIHVNTIAAIILSLLPFLLKHFSVYEITALIIAMSVMHTFVDYIPSILLGAPREDSVLSVLPGHRMLMRGRGYEAIRLTVVGGMGSMILIVAILPLGLIIFPIIYSYARKILSFLLFGVLSYMVLTEKNLRTKLFSIALILYSGVLGILILNYESPRYALFPALTGLFGISTLLISLKTQAKIPGQDVAYSEGTYTAGIVIGSLGGILTGLLPSISSSQSAVIIQNIFRNKDEKEFLVALGGINTADAIYALFALYLIGTPRSGASIALEQIMKEFTFLDLLFAVGVILTTAFFAVSFTLFLAKFFVKKIQEVNYEKFSMGILLSLGILIFLFTGLKGILIAVTATGIGIASHLSGIKRSSCMAVLIVPTILYFL